MKISTLRTASVLMVISVFGLTSSLALARQEGKAKGKTIETAKENSGRQAGELPSGLQKHTEKKGQLPAGLQKNKDEDGQLTKGLEKGGKKASAAKTSKPVK